MKKKTKKTSGKAVQETKKPAKRKEVEPRKPVEASRERPSKPVVPAGSEPHPDEKLKRDRYFEAVGRRKTSIARVRLFTKSGDFTVNGKLHVLYFPTLELQKIVEDALQKMKLWGRFRISVIVSGGGIHSQAEAIRHGLARCLIKFNPDFRKRLKRAEFLKRDPRMRERKKFGLKKARRAPQWQKR